MTEQLTEETGAPQPAPTSEAPEQPKERKEPAKKDSGLPVGQIAVGGLGATVLGSAALVSVVGPLGWLAAPAAATAGGVGYVAWKRRKKHGRTTSGRRTQQSKTVTSRTVGGGRLGGAGLSAGRGRAAGASTRSGGAPAGSRRPGVSGGAAAAARPPGGRGGGSTGGRGGGPSPYSGTGRRGGSSRGSSPRGLSPRGGSRPSSPRGLFGRGSDTTSRKRTSRPVSSGGGTTPRGGSTPKNRWGGGSGGSDHHKGRGSRIGRGAARARDWADDRTGRKASAAWKAASGQRGFRARSRAASRAVRSKGGGRIISSAVGVITAAFAGLASLLGRPKTRKPSRRRTPPLDTPAGWYAKDGYKLGPEVPGMPGAFYADPRDTRPGYVDDRGYTTGSYDANVDPRTWDERVAAGDVPGFSPKTSTTTTGGTTMTGNRSLPHAQHAADMLASVTRHEPEDLFVVIDQARQWPDFVRDTAMAVRTYVQVLQANRFPLKNSSVEALQELYAALLKTMPAAEAIHTQMCIDHAVDLDRANFDRGDERRANVR